jgi:putative hydroxymethylpyrimidine transport system ATP-binding protein
MEKKEFNLKIPAYEYDHHRVLQHIDINLPLKGWVTLWGQSGIGKTTLLKAIIENYHRYYSMAYLGQDYNLLPWATVLDNVLLGFKLRQDKENFKPKALELLEQSGLSGYASAYPHHLSAGMQQRAAFVRILLENADIILLDEPFSKLDWATKQTILALAKPFLENRLVLSITHDFEEAFALSDQIWVLEGTPATLKEPLTVEAFKNKILAQRVKAL